jgi:hypothetical protein
MISPMTDTDSDSCTTASTDADPTDEDGPDYDTEDPGSESEYAGSISPSSSASDECISGQKRKPTIHGDFEGDERAAKRVREEKSGRGGAAKRMREEEKRGRGGL